MKTYIITFVLALGLTTLAYGTSENWNTPASPCGTNSMSDSLYIGPSAVINMPAGCTWNIFSTTVYIHPDATITGAGTIYFRDRTAASLTASAVTIDGGGAKIDVNVVLENQSNMVLGQVATPAGSGWTAAEGGAMDNLYLGKNFEFNDTWDSHPSPPATVTNNHVLLGAYDMIFDSDATVSGYTQDRYAVTASTGNMIKEGLNGMFIFPVGYSEATGLTTDYTPAKVTDTGGATFEVSADDYAAATSGGCTISTPEPRGMDRTWEIMTSSGSAAGATVTLQHNDATTGGSYVPNQFVTRCVGTAPNSVGGETSNTVWDFVGTSNCGSESGTGTQTTGTSIATATELSRSGLTDFSTYTHYTKAVCSPNVLPIELTHFGLTETEHGVLISWTTGSEIENLGFVLERRIGDAEFTEIASYKTDDALLGQGSVEYSSDYEFVDSFVEAGVTYDYRLADVDYNGVVTYNGVRSITVEITPSLAQVPDEFTVRDAYPNPFNPSTTISYALPAVERNTTTIVQIYDLTGKLVKTLLNEEQPSGWHSVVWNGTDQVGNQVPAGVYLSKVSFGSDTKTIKVMLLK